MRSNWPKCVVAFGSSFNVLIKHSILYVMIPAEIARGALSGLGLIGVVVREINNRSQRMQVSAFLLIYPFQRAHSR